MVIGPTGLSQIQLASKLITATNGENQNTVTVVIQSQFMEDTHATQALDSLKIRTKSVKQV